MSHLGVVVNKESEVLVDEAIGGELFSDRVRGHGTPKYGTLAYWIFRLTEFEKVTETERPLWFPPVPPFPLKQMRGAFPTPGGEENSHCHDREMPRRI